MLNRYRAERIVVAIKHKAHYSKVFQILFSKNDGSVFINFPYFKHSKGMVIMVTLPAGAKYPYNVNFGDSGKVTSHLVKYTHHPDGMAHFSQDGRVKTQIRKQSLALAELDGHFFTVQVQGLNAYDALNQEPENFVLSNRKGILSYLMSNSPGDTFKFVGRWFSEANAMTRSTGPIEGPIVTGITPEGIRRTGFLLAAPETYPFSDYCLMLTCESRKQLSNDPAVLTFAGAFDHSNVINDHSKDTTFLYLSYPLENFEELKNRLGTIDLR